jgi:hypothetical protein
MSEKTKDYVLMVLKYIGIVLALYSPMIAVLIFYLVHKDYDGIKNIVVFSLAILGNVILLYPIYTILKFDVGNDLEELRKKYKDN